jgi:hypothetical protein
MTRGKSRNRKARIDIMRSREANARRRSRQHYDRKRYDGHASEGNQ